MKSMTGYGYAERQEGGFKCALEIKGYNGRYLDVVVNVPPAYGSLEPRVRAWISARVARGSVELSVRIKETGGAGAVSADLEAAKSAYGALIAIKKACGIPGRPSLQDLLSVEGILKLDRESDRESAWTVVEPLLAECGAQFERSRIAEGEATKKDILGQLDRVESALAAVRARVPEIEASVKDNLRRRFEELLPGAVDENRVLAETAVQLVKATVSEECGRAAAHIASFRKMAADDPAPGKKLDFISQELNREFNTIGSKSQIVEISQEVVSAKEAIENIREQLRNVE